MGWRKRVWTGVREPPPGFAVPSLEPPTREVPVHEFREPDWIEVLGGTFEFDARPVEPETGVVRVGRWKEPNTVLSRGLMLGYAGARGIWQVRSLHKATGRTCGTRWARSLYP